MGTKLKDWMNMKSNYINYRHHMLNKTKWTHIFIQDQHQFLQCSLFLLYYEHKLDSQVTLLWFSIQACSGYHIIMFCCWMYRKCGHIIRLFGCASVVTVVKFSWRCLISSDIFQIKVLLAPTLISRTSRKRPHVMCIMAQLVYIGASAGTHLES